MRKKTTREPITAAQYRELIHLLNRRCYEERQRAERLQADLELIQALRATWLFRSVKRLKRWMTSLIPRPPKDLVNVPMAMEPVQPSGRVSIIIPFKDRLELLRDCLRSLRASTYHDYEVILVDNGSTDPQMHRYLCRALLHKRYHVVHCPGPFNFSHLCNRGAEQAQGEHLLFLNNDTLLISPDWLEQMLIVAQQPSVGIVGATLLYPDGTIQHGGLYQRHDGIWDHLYRNELWATLQDAEELRLVRAVSAVTAACMLISRDLYLELEGFDENLPLIHNDTDLCQRVRQQGHCVAITPHAQLFHYESLSRGFGDPCANNQHP